jgi:hypothetical protein
VSGEFVRPLCSFLVTCDCRSGLSDAMRGGPIGRPQGQIGSEFGWENGLQHRSGRSSGHQAIRWGRVSCRCGSLQPGKSPFSVLVSV